MNGRDAADGESFPTHPALAAQPDERPLALAARRHATGAEVRSREYIVPTLLTILLGGMQEPGHACGSTMLGLFTQPAQLRRVVEDKRLIPKAVQEGLRWLSPITTTMGRRPKQG
jgi:aromatic O-demethylase, cytochrome P450 subunit